MKTLRISAIAAIVALAAGAARADAVDQLRAFVSGVQTGRAHFEQTVTAPDGAARKASGGSFEFKRPDRFRFDYTTPYPQQIVADGQKVWVSDPDLNQVTVRKFDQAIGATPAALLAGATLDRDFTLADQPSRDGLDWARATPKTADGAFKWMAVGFQGKTLAAVEILDRFGQRTVLRLSGFEANVPLAADRFHFTAPKGADIVEQ
jgi:outer membrane lipoprotein carrier protein